MRVVLPLMVLACGAPRPSEPAHEAEHAEAPSDPTPAGALTPHPAPELGEVAVAYVVSFDRAAQQLVDVVATARVDAAEQTWMMPVWTPGSYLVREYARHVEGVVAEAPDGTERSVTKIAKNRWTVDTAGLGEVTLRWTVYANEPSVRTDYVDADTAILSPAATFLVPVEATGGPFEVTWERPDHWAPPATGLASRNEVKGDNRFLAADLDELVDSPFIDGGDLSVLGFHVDGVHHQLAELGGMDIWDHTKALEDVEAVTRAHIDFWGEIPYDHYVFLNVIGHGRGGLEHLDSTLMMTRRLEKADESGWKDWLGLVSHEFFHTWNVKRLRPEGLGPFDYETEVYTPSLWVAEGWTSYYDDLLLVRAGLLTPDEHLGRLSDSIAGLQGRPGRHVQSLAAASHDAWIKHYRPDENSVNTSVSYYRKGSLVAWLLDGEIRRRTQDRKSLDDVARALWSRHDTPYTPEDVVAAASDVAGADLATFFAAYVTGTDELDYGPVLDWYGLRFAPASSDDPEAWIGLEAGGQPFTVRSVLRDTPAWELGLIVGDEIVGLDGERVTAGSWTRLQRRYAPGDEAELLIARHGQLRSMRVTFGAEPTERWRLQIAPTSGTVHAQRRARWWQTR